jgi:hypothetical protein
MAHLAPNGASVEAADFLIWFGANDWAAGKTAAQVSASVLAIADYAASLGMRTTVFTDAPGNGDYTATQENHRQDFNDLLRGSRERFDSLLDLDVAFGTHQDRRWWYDQVHPNKAGYRQISQLLIHGRDKVDPKIKSIILDVDMTVADDVITAVPLTAATSEGLGTMAFYLEPYERVTLAGVFYVLQASNPLNFRVGLTVPAGCLSLINNAAAGKSATGVYSFTDVGQAPTLLATSSGGALVGLSAWLKNGATAGVVTITFSQFSTAPGDPATLQEGSSLRITRREN